MPGEVAGAPDTFSAALRQLRRATGISLRDLGLKVHYSKGHLSKIENGAVPGSLDLAEACDAALGARGRLTAAFAADLAGQPPLPGKAKAKANAPFDLPPPPSHFTGRDAEVARVIGAITGARDGQRAPAVIIHGMPGSGKTALALHVAHAVRARFPGGCLYLDLSSGAGPAHRSLLRRLGLPDSEIPAEPDEAGALYRSVLYRRAVLVVADGVTSSSQVIALESASPGCAVIATSRRLLPALDNCEPMLLPPLAVKEAAQLFRVVSGRDDLGPEPDVLRVAAACGGLPLAVRVAAAAIRASRRSAAELADLLESADTVWPALDDGERSVHRELAAELGALTEGARRTLAMLALHPGEFVARHPAAWLTGREPRSVEADFAELLGRDLITVNADGQARPRGLLRSFSPGIADERLRRDALGRLVAGYTRTAEAADAVLVPSRFRPTAPGRKEALAAISFGDQAEAMAWCRAEASLVPRLCSLALEQGRHDDCWRLAYAMRDYFFAARALEPWLASHRIALLAAQRCGDRWAQATTRNNLGLALTEQGQTAAAQAQYRQALGLLREVDDQRGIATTLGHQAWASYAAGQPETAIELAEQARQLSRRHDNRRSLAIMDRTAALAYAGTGRYREAGTLLAECREILDELDLPLDVAMTFNCLGEVHYAMGRFTAARTWHALARERSAACGGVAEQARAVKGLAAAARAGR